MTARTKIKGRMASGALAAGAVALLVAGVVAFSGSVGAIEPTPEPVRLVDAGDWQAELDAKLAEASAEAERLAADEAAAAEAARIEAERVAEVARLEAIRVEAERVAAEQAAQAAQAEADRVAQQSRQQANDGGGNGGGGGQAPPQGNGIPAGAWPLPWVESTDPQNAEGGYYDDSSCSGGSDTFGGVPYCTP